MGLKLFLSISEPDLCSGNTFAYFHSEMNLPDCKKRIRMKARGWAIMGAAAPRSLSGSLSEPTALFSGIGID